ncbi:MAG TPA: ABC transporter substrate-binding protein [Candidatus Paceibacterota bacterium]|nr:ABC transporter substrate-binding protein [Verrucomicrobiota bacterium]HRZ44336.1 ABC transporter substrate-binding protein [Candidatus Paceibacterota bacterium]HRZ94710.1 ABC transporter substrate-binding protein [Candidatus Paceibacterota bacterium]
MVEFRFMARAVLACGVAGIVLGGGLSDAMGAARVVVISPHNESIRHEFREAFRRHHEQRFAEPAEVEWRDMGGSTDALRFVLSEFARKPDGIGIDCFFGGGLEPFLRLTAQGLTEACLLPPEVIDGIPQTANGVDVYDPQQRWFGAALSSFGILQSPRIQRLTGLPAISTWEQLADPALCGWVGAGDPRNSGTMSTMFECFLQAFGWEKGWSVLARIGGNTRKFDRFSATTAKDVSLGETAYAMAIDFYGFTQVAAAGRTNLTFTLPRDFSTLVPDGIALLKGAPNRLAAERFMAFVLGEPGQKLWFLPRGHPEGPQRYSMERMAVRPDFYARFRGISNIETSPFDLSQPFAYDGALARARGEVVAALVGALLVDTHTELRRAWRAVIRRGLEAADIEALGRTPITDAEARALAAGPWKDPVIRNQKKIEWQQWAQEKYLRLESHARRR